MRIAALLLLALLGALFALVLPPRQTADLVGLLCTLGGHMAVTAAALWLKKQGSGLLLCLGWGVVLTLYWLLNLGITLVFRSFSFTAAEWLLFLQFALAAAAGMSLWAFYRARGLDNSTRQEVLHEEELD